MTEQVQEPEGVELPLDQHHGLGGPDGRVVEREQRLRGIEPREVAGLWFDLVGDPGAGAAAEHVVAEDRPEDPVTLGPVVVPLVRRDGREEVGRQPPPVRQRPRP